MGLWLHLEAPKAVTNFYKKYEYKIVDFDQDVDSRGKVLLDWPGNTENRRWGSMNVLGREGWELVQIVKSDLRDYASAIFKRRVYEVEK